MRRGSEELRRGLVLAAAIVQLALFAALLAWRTAGWDQRGWAGLTFVPALEVAAGPPLAGFLSQIQGAVLRVAPDSPAARAGIVVGDLVVSVDGVQTGYLPGLWRLARRKQLGDHLVYEILTETGRERFAVSLVSPLRRFATLLAMASSFLAGAGFLAVSLLVVRARSRSESAFVLSLTSSFGAAFFFISSASELDLPDLRGIVPMGAQPSMWALFAVYTLLTLVLTNLLLHLSLIFPRPRPIARRRPAVFRWLHTLPFLPFAALVVAAGVLTASERTAGLWTVEITAAATVAVLLGRLARGRRDGLKETLLAHPLSCQLLALAAVGMVAPAARLLDESAMVVGVVAGYFGLLAFLTLVLTVYSLLTCAAFLRGYRESGEEGKQRVLWPFWGTTVALAGITILSMAGLAASLSPNGPAPAIYPWAHASSRLLYPLIPASFACGILGYRLPFRRRAAGR